VIFVKCDFIFLTVPNELYKFWAYTFCIIFSFQGHKKIAGNNTTADRFRLLVSDGRHLNSFAMLATQLNDKVTSGELCDYTVIQITRYITSMVANPDKGEKYVTL